MQSSSYQFLMWSQAVLYSVLYMVACAILFVGWKRHRQFGYLILAAWAGVAATWGIGRGLVMPFVSRGASILKMDDVTLHMLINLSSTLILSSLLLLGVCLLVFQQRKS